MDCARWVHFAERAEEVSWLACIAPRVEFMSEIDPVLLKITCLSYDCLVLCMMSFYVFLSINFADGDNLEVQQLDMSLVGRTSPLSGFREPTQQCTAGDLG